MKKFMVAALLLSCAAFAQARVHDNSAPTHNTYRPGGNTDSGLSRFAFGWTFTDLYMENFYVNWGSFQFEFLISDGFSLQIPLSLKITSTYTVMLTGIGARWYPLHLGLQGFYLGTRLNAKFNITSSAIIPVMDAEIGWKFAGRHFFVEPETGYALNLAPTGTPAAVFNEYTVGIRTGFLF